MSEDAPIEETETFQPRFGPDGLVTVIVEDARTSETLMLAHADAAALEATVRTGVAHFWSRSRRELWRKGATSGNELRVDSIWTDCDQDAVLYRVEVEGGGVACHTGRRSCFYRRLEADGQSLSKDDRA